MLGFLNVYLCAMNGVGVGEMGGEELFSTLSLGTKLQGMFRSRATCPCFSFTVNFSPGIKGKSIEGSSCSIEESGGCFPLWGCPRASSVSALLLIHLAHDKRPTRWANPHTSVPAASCHYYLLNVELHCCGFWREEFIISPSCSQGCISDLL